MHVADIWTCDANGNPKTAFIKGETFYWKVKIIDASGNPVAGATVTVEEWAPNGSLWFTRTGTTGADGIVTMSRGTNGSTRTGTHTLKVTNVTKSGWTYNPGANVKSETQFTIS